MIVSVTGASGFVGSNLAHELLKKGHSVRILARKPESVEKFRKLNAQIFQGDLVNGELDRFVDNSEVLFHCAAKVGEWGTKNEFYQSNVIGTRRLMESALDRKVKRVVYLSTVDVYGQRNHAGENESSPLMKCPHHYGASKLEAELLVRRMVAEQGLPAVIVQPGYIYGPGDNALIPKLKKVMAKKSLLTCNGGKNNIGLVHIRDLCDLLCRAGFHDVPKGKVYIAVGDEHITFANLISELQEIYGLPGPVFDIPFPIVSGLAYASEAVFSFIGKKETPLITVMGIKILHYDYGFSNHRAKEELGWVPKITLREGLRELASIN